MQLPDGTSLLHLCMCATRFSRFRVSRVPVTRGSASRSFVALRPRCLATCRLRCRGSLTWGGKHRITRRGSSSSPVLGLVVHLYRARAFHADIPILAPSLL